MPKSLFPLLLALSLSYSPLLAQSLPFTPNVRVSRDESFLHVHSDGLPNHKTGTFPNRDNPNRILRQQYHFLIPLHPRRAPHPVPLPMGPIGVAVNGIPFYNPYNARGQDAVDGPFAEVFDSCCGHPDEWGRYHYHKYPVCLKSPFKDEPGVASPLIGYAFDGYEIYGPNCREGVPPTDLDECNGHECDDRGYHYHVTEKFPYILGAYRGHPETRNFANPLPMIALGGCVVVLVLLLGLVLWLRRRAALRRRKMQVSPFGNSTEVLS